jgi:hypothetical protein
VRRGGGLRRGQWWRISSSCLRSSYPGHRRYVRESPPLYSSDKIIAIVPLQKFIFPDSVYESVTWLRNPICRVPVYYIRYHATSFEVYTVPDLLNITEYRCYVGLNLRSATIPVSCKSSKLLGVERLGRIGRSLSLVPLIWLLGPHVCAFCHVEQPGYCWSMSVWRDGKMCTIRHRTSSSATPPRRASIPPNSPALSLPLSPGEAMAGDGDTHEPRGAAPPGPVVYAAPPMRTRYGSARPLEWGEIVCVFLPFRAVDPSGVVDSRSSPSPSASTTRAPGSIHSVERD